MRVQCDQRRAWTQLAMRWSGSPIHLGRAVELLAVVNTRCNRVCQHRKSLERPAFTRLQDCPSLFRCNQSSAVLICQTFSRISKTPIGSHMLDHGGTTCSVTVFASQAIWRECSERSSNSKTKPVRCVLAARRLRQCERYRTRRSRCLRHGSRKLDSCFLLHGLQQLESKVPHP